MHFQLFLKKKVSVLKNHNIFLPSLINQLKLLLIILSSVSKMISFKFLRSKLISYEIKKIKNVLGSLTIQKIKNVLGSLTIQKLKTCLGVSKNSMTT